MTPAVSVIIVNYNAGSLLTDCLRAILGSDLAIEIHVSDNGSTDASLEGVRRAFDDDPRIHLHENGRNLGFSAGNNRVLTEAKAPFLLFLNPDCIVDATTLTRMHAFMEATPDAGLASCIIRNPNGSEQVATRRAIPNPWVGALRLLSLECLWPDLLKGGLHRRGRLPLPPRPIAVEAVSGAFMMVRRTALDDVGPLDEGYFLHCEDLDWFVRFARAGWKIYLVPDVEVVHYKGACSTSRPLIVEWHKHRGMERFFRKFQYHAYPLPVSLLVIGGIWLRFALVALGTGLRLALSSLGRSGKR